jgi:peptide/nickel transport system permease protein
MPPLLRFFLTRLLTLPVTLLIVTAALYGVVMLTPPQARAELYLSKGINPDRLPPEKIQDLTERIIKRYHLRDPYPIQYGIWISNLLKGNWGYSPTLNDNVLDALVKRTPVTAELTIYSILLFIPLGLASGVIAGRNQNRPPDNRFRFFAFTATSLPPFIVAILLMAVFYVMLHWFSPERLGLLNSQAIRSPDWRNYTGLLTIDGFLNHRPDISIDALRHLVMPVVTLSLFHWATLGRVTRAAMIEEMHKEYLVAGKARGISNRSLIWRHAFRNALTPSLASSALSAASLFTGVFVVEMIFNFKGISDMVVYSFYGPPDSQSVLGFAVYSVLIVLLVMLVLDIVQAIFDPRIRRGILNS